MSTSLLVTKFYHPSVRARLVPRQRLYERLDAGLAGKLILVSAPAGYGKSTLLSAWTQRLVDRDGEPISVAWLSLDPGDNETAQFLRYIFAALQGIYGGCGLDAQAALDVHPLPPIEPLVISLINDIAACARQGLLVLDDYHAIANRVIHDMLDFVLDHLPPQLHLVINTRVDPPLGLDRLRVRGYLTELRQKDLAFTEEETSAFLQQVMGVALSPENMATLGARTEGWIAGLQLAGLSLQNRDTADQQSFVHTFGGTHRRVAGYLMGEVFDRQSERVQGFLLHTSVLDRLCGPLCETLCASEDVGSGQEMLVWLEEANLFLIPLDDERRWYRYHHLFGEFLRHRLGETHPERVIELHRRASAWFESQAMLAEAIEEAFAGEDPARAARLLQSIGNWMLTRNELARLKRWLDKVPEAVLLASPRLALLHARVLDRLEEYHDACRVLAAIGATTDEVSEEMLGVASAMLRSHLAYAQGDHHRALAQAHLAVECLPKEAPAEWPDLRAWALHSLAQLELGTGGDLAAASHYCSEVIELAERHGERSLRSEATAVLASVLRLQGRLVRAGYECERGLQWLNAGSVSAHEGTVGLAGDVLHHQYSMVLYERNDLAGCEAHLCKALELCQLAGSWKLPDCYRRFAYLRMAQNDLEGAFEMYARFVSASKAHGAQAQFVKVVHQATAMSLATTLVTASPAHSYLLEEVARWVEGCGLTTENTLDYRLRFESMALVRALVGIGQPQRACALVEPMVTACLMNGRQGDAIELLAIQAVAWRFLGDTSAALEALARALELAEPEGYVRTFVDLGEPMRSLLSDLLATKREGDNSLPAGSAVAYVERLLLAYPSRDIAQQPRGPAGQPVAPFTLAVPTLIGPLSERELDVLRLMSRGLRNTDIAKELFVSVNTVRFHAKNIFGKLLVQNRVQAIARATDLHLL